MPPGPRPSPEPWPADCLPADDEELSFLTGDFRILQLRRGHRWSLDDLVTAWLAATSRDGRPTHRCLDLGCGIGSVLMSVAWAFREARCVGVEAQDRSFDLVSRSLRLNGLTDRVRVVHGDLRAFDDAGEAPFDLVTGTPPYFDVRAGTVSGADQRGPCRFETRGGIEAYCEAAARWLAADGSFVVVETAREDRRVMVAAHQAGLGIERVIRVVPKVGKLALISLFVMRRGTVAAPPVVETLTVRDARDQWTPAFAEIRLRMGLPPRLDPR